MLVLAVVNHDCLDTWFGRQARPGLLAIAKTRLLPRAVGVNPPLKLLAFTLSALIPGMVGA